MYSAANTSALSLLDISTTPSSMIVNPKSSFESSTGGCTFPNASVKISLNFFANSLLAILSAIKRGLIMKIQLIGTGTIPDIANSASVLINDHILFDMPNGNLKAMIRQNIDIMRIDTLIISHTHADHCFDVPFLLWYKKDYYKS